MVMALLLDAIKLSSSAHADILPRVPGEQKRKVYELHEQCAIDVGVAWAKCIKRCGLVKGWEGSSSLELHNGLSIPCVNVPGLFRTRSIECKIWVLGLGGMAQKDVDGEMKDKIC